MEVNKDARKKLCKYCGAGFDTRGRYDAHYRREHQNKVGRAEANTARQTDDRKFQCVCSREYARYQSLKRHQEHCEVWQRQEITLERGEIAPDGVELSLESEFQGNNQEGWWITVRGGEFTDGRRRTEVSRSSREEFREFTKGFGGSGGKFTKGTELTEGFPASGSKFTDGTWGTEKSGSYRSEFTECTEGFWGFGGQFR
jgi:hypothetical protein